MQRLFESTMALRQGSMFAYKKLTKEYKPGITATENTEGASEISNAAIENSEAAIDFSTEAIEKAINRA